ncbi:MAG TPA: metallophosphoesterase family protein [Pseudonocardiaceae bacterium]
MDREGTSAAAEPGGPEESATWVVGDVHGHRDEMVDALRAAGLVDANEAWCGGTARLWFLGDFFDRGPDGAGVVDVVMRLVDQAEEARGEVRALLGNHEILALGVHRFGATEVPSGMGKRSFQRSWEINGGQPADQDALSDAQVKWLAELPVLAHAGDQVLMHSDTIEYFRWGRTEDEINSAVRELLAGDDIVEWWECWRRMTTRYAFRGPFGAQVADEVLRQLGGRRIVHGHSLIPEQLGIHPEDVEGPYLYAGGMALNVDGGLFLGGPCLVVRLPWSPDEEDASPDDTAEDDTAEDDTAETGATGESGGDEAP